MSAKRLRFVCTVTVATVLVVGTGRAQADASGGSINCMSDLPAYGPLNVTQVMGAGTSGVLTLGGDNNKFIGTCNLTGTIPGGWTVDELSGATLSAAGGSGNAGTFDWNTDDSLFAVSGSFANSGTFTDSSSGFSQQIEATDFVNTGTVRSDSTGFSIAGTTTRFDNQGVVQVDANASFGLAGSFLLEPSGTIKAVGVFDLAGSTFEVRGGSVSAGVLTSPYHLGVAPTSIVFAAGLPPSSKGTIELEVPASLGGVVAKGWTLTMTASVTAARGSGNAGTIEWASGAGDSTFSDTSPFLNSGTFADDAAGLSQQIAVAKFVNSGKVVSRAPGFGLSGTTSSFVDRGVVSVASKAVFGAAGTFLLEPGGTIHAAGVFDIGGSTFEVAGGSATGAPLSNPYHLGVGATTIKFSSRLQRSSKGSIDIEVPTTVDGPVPKSWKLVLKGGQIVAHP